MEKLSKESYAPDDNESATKDAYKTLFVVREMNIHSINS